MSDFASKARSAVMWNAGFNIFRDGLQFCTMLVLVRVLPQEAYGEFGFVTSVVGFISIFAFGNFIAHTLQVKEAEETHFQDHFSAGAILNLAMCAITNVVALVLHSSPTWSTVAPLLHVMSITFILEWPCELRRKMIEREFDWKTLRVLHAWGLLLTASLALGMAWAGLGTYALLVPGMAVTLPFIYDLFVRQRWRPTWQWSWSRYRPSFQFGLARMGSGLVFHGRTLMEAGTLAAVLGFTSLGVLNRSIGLAQLFCVKIASQLVYAIYPILTRVGGDEKNTARVNLLVIQTVAWTTVPVATAFGLLSAPVVGLIYGDKWLNVVPLIPWAMAWGATTALCQASYMLLLACHHPKRCLIADATILLGTLAALKLALPHGILVYLMATTATQAGVLALVTYWLWRMGAIKAGGWMSAFFPALVASAGSCLVIHWLSGAPRAPGEMPVLVALLWGGGFLLVYGLLLRIGFRSRIEAMIPYLPLRSIIRKVLLMPQPNTGT